MLPFIVAAAFFLAFSAELFAQTAGLIEAGRPAAEGAAVASRLSLPDYELRVGTLGTIAALGAGLQAPALVIVGDVVHQAVSSHGVQAIGSRA